MVSRVRRFVVSGLIVLGLLAALMPLSATARSAPYMNWPTVGHETQGYGCTGFKMEPRRGDCAHFHAGIDIANKSGTPVRAAADGTIAYVGREPWYHGTDRAWVVIISHGNGIKTIYVHLQARAMQGVARGRHVVEGQLIGLMGMTGRATGPHLHFGVWLYHRGVDPTKYMPSTTPPLR
ncbi:MAG: M23 family metallopeptidase [Chloroflexota bacterium]